MIISWIFSSISLLCLLIAKQYDMLAVGTEPLLLSLSLIVASPWIIGVIHEIKGDLWFLDGRICFTLALAGLISTVLALVYDMSAFAEQASIWVYLMLVCGVVLELLSPLSARLYRLLMTRISLPPGLMIGYKDTLREYSSVLLLALGIVYVGLLVWRISLWNFDLSMLPLLSAGLWVFFAIVLLTHHKRYGIMDLISTELGWIERWIPSRYRSIAYPLITGLIIGILVDIAYFRGLTLSTQIVGIGALTLLILIGSLVYPVVSRWVRSNRYIQELFS